MDTISRQREISVLSLTKKLPQKKMYVCTYIEITIYLQNIKNNLPRKVFDVPEHVIIWIPFLPSNRLIIEE